MQSGILGCSSKGETELPVKSHDNAETRARARSLVCILMSKHVIIHYASPRMNSAGAACTCCISNGNVADCDAGEKSRTLCCIRLTWHRESAADERYAQKNSLIAH
jgi:hypothetical protein